MKHVKLFEEFVFELADSSKIYEYKLTQTYEDDVKVWQAHFTTSSGLDYVCNLIDSDDSDKNTLRRYSDKMTGGVLKPTKLKNIRLNEMSYYEVNYKRVGDDADFNELTKKGEMPSIVSTCFTIIKDVFEQDGEPRFFGFHFTGTAKDKDEDLKDATQKTKIYRYFVSKLMPYDFVPYEDGNTTRIIRVK